MVLIWLIEGVLSERNSVEIGNLTYYQKNRDVILNRAKDYYKNDKERLKEQARDKYRHLSEGEKNKKRIREEQIWQYVWQKKTKIKRISKKLLQG